MVTKLKSNSEPGCSTQWLCHTSKYSQCELSFDRHHARFLLDLQDGANIIGGGGGWLAEIAHA